MNLLFLFESVFEKRKIVPFPKNRSSICDKTCNLESCNDFDKNVKHVSVLNVDVFFCMTFKYLITMQKNRVCVRNLRTEFFLPITLPLVPKQFSRHAADKSFKFHIQQLCREFTHRNFTFNCNLVDGTVGIFGEIIHNFLFFI